MSDVTMSTTGYCMICGGPAPCAKHTLAGTLPPRETTYRLPPYEGNDMIGYMLKLGWVLPTGEGPIRSMANVRDMAIIVTDRAVLLAKPHAQIGFTVALVISF